MTTQPPKPTNQKTFADYAATATELGEKQGTGKDSQVKFMLSLIEGGYHGTLDLGANKHGTEIDDATKLSEMYVKAANQAAIFDAKASNQRKLISTARTGIKLGGWPKGGHGEPIATVNNLVSMRQALRKQPGEAKKLDDANNMLLKYARAQLKSDRLIDDPDQLKQFCYKPNHDLLTAEQIIDKTVKQLDRLLDGSASQNTASCNTANIKAARHALRQELAAIATARGKTKGPNGV